MFTSKARKFLEKFAVGTKVRALNITTGEWEDGEVIAHVQAPRSKGASEVRVGFGEDPRFNWSDLPVGDEDFITLR